MNSTVVLLLGLLPVSVFVLWPLFTGDEDALEPPEPENESAGLELQKFNAYSALKEVEFDQRTGKLSAEDYEKLVQRYKGQALDAIAGLERQHADHVTSAAGANAGAKREVRFCPTCGAPTASGAKFCAGCGKPVPQQ